MVRPSPDPAERLRQQALRLRRLWRSLRVEERMRLGEGLRDDVLGRTWRQILGGNHPLADWLESEASWPPDDRTWDGPEARALVTSHPLARRKPWSSPTTSETSSSTPPAS